MSLICMFAYVCMLLRTSHLLYLCTHRLHVAAALALPSRMAPLTVPISLTCSVPAMWLELHDRSAVLKTIVQTNHFHIRLCWVKLYSAVSLGDMPCSEIVQCVLWRSFGDSQWEWKPATECYDWHSTCPEPWSSSACSLVSTVTLLCAVWRTICWSHPIQVLVDMATATLDRPFAARHTMPAVRVVAVVYYAVLTMRLLLSACCLPLVAYFGWHSRFYTLLQTPFHVYLLVFP